MKNEKKFCIYMAIFFLTKRSISLFYKKLSITILLVSCTIVIIETENERVSENY